MGLFVPEDSHYDPSIRQKGFNRYKQLLSEHAGSWWKLGALTAAGFVPLAAGIFLAVQTSSILVLIPCSLIGGMIAGPFLAGLYDAVLRGLRDDFQNYWKAYRRAWRQNWRDGMALGAVTGLLTGLYVFMGMLFWWAQSPPGWEAVLLYLFSLLLFFVFNTLLWPQVVLFRQKTTVRIRNALLFLLRYFWRVMGAGLLQLVYAAFLVLFAPWTLLLLPVTGIWYIVFLCQFLIYDTLNEAFHVEESYQAEP